MSGSSWTARWEVDVDVDVYVVVDDVVVDALIVFKPPVFDGHKHGALCSEQTNGMDMENLQGVTI